MFHLRLPGIVAFGLLAAAPALPRHTLTAQSTQVAPARTSQSVQLAFGYECGDRFLVRNDGAEPVDVEYGVAGETDRSTLHLKEREAVELNSASDKAVELWVNGSVAATALKGKRDCTANAYSSGVVVRPIGPGDYVSNVGVAYPVVYLDAWPYYGFYPPYASVVVPFFPRFGGFGFVGFRGRGRFGR